MITVEGALAAEGHDQGYARFLDKVEIIRRTITALTLSDKFSPTTGVSWLDFHDPDLSAASVGHMWRSATFDGRQADHPVEFRSEALEWAERFIALDGEVASKCDVALARLNLARRRREPGDQAIDGCIALEALLGDGQTGDLTYRLRLRSARLLGSSFAGRMEISDLIRDFYALRSKVVHGRSKGASPADRSTAQRGLELVLATLRQVVSTGRIPGPSELELGPADAPPGPPIAH